MQPCFQHHQGDIEAISRSGEFEHSKVTFSMLAMRRMAFCAFVCPYKNYKCSVCNRRGHKESQCRTRKASQRRSQTRRSRSKRSQSEPRFNAILATFDNQIDAHRKYVTIRANGSTIRLLIDTASDIKIVSRRTWRKIGSLKLRPAMNTTRNASGGKPQLLGDFNCEIEIAGHPDCGIVYLAACELHLLCIDCIDRLHLSTLPIENLCSSTPTVGKPTFRSGKRVLVKNYRPGHRRWTVGALLRIIDQVIYNVKVGSLIWKRHVNQLRPTDRQVQKAEEQLLDLSLLLETVDIIRPTPIATASQVPPKTDPLLQARRRTGHSRKLVEPSQLDPRRQSYAERPQGGEVSGGSGC
ncbi:hypothetical protein CLF_104546 [Clonorchis sinensis]|uniref:Peptidase A2 domain-containing protein n=1 Tax=Clonorchis sinensis TaxID=79923 RepID=G7YBV7_CLOSI|nr:hypothetical protein CLF_104546 [Clonorchis sinensis]